MPVPEPRARASYVIAFDPTIALGGDRLPRDRLGRAGHRRRRRRRPVLISYDGT